MDACSYSGSCIGAEIQATASSMHLVEYGLTKRDNHGAVVNEVVRYTNDKIAKREADAIAI